MARHASVNYTGQRYEIELGRRAMLQCATPGVAGSKTPRDGVRLWNIAACLRFHFGVRRLASALTRRQLAVAYDTPNAQVTASCHKEKAVASYRTP
ncbi:MAG: hypothetical protein ACUVTH_11075 [Thermogutta sp.]